MLKPPKKIPEWLNVDNDIFQQEIIPKYQPAVLKGIFLDWPIVRAGKESVDAISEYLKKFDRGALVDAFIAPPSVQGNFSYQENVREFNFQKITESFESCLARIISCLSDENPPAVYMGSANIAECLPGLMKENICNLVGPSLLPRIWMGNQTIIQPHFDYPDNIACVIAGRRRFTLFPPEQIDNLYVGPIDFTPAGQAISLVSINNPDYKKFPRFKQALAEAMVAELEPGDAIYIPSLWWHNVQALEKFNLLINYWSNSGIGLDSPHDALLYGLMTIRSLPEKERNAWRHFFDHYVFQTNGNPVEHLSPNARGVLGEMSPTLYKAIRNYLHKRLSRPN